MGTPEFAVPSLERIYNAGYEIGAVVTAPDKPSGRGMKLTESAVKKFASQKNLKILQPEKLKSADFINNLQEIKADLQVVVAFRMLPEIVWNMPPMGTINLHASLLPQYRGAAPINWVIINGEKETGVTTFKLQHEIDTGNILLQKRIPILDSDTAGTLHDKMMYEGADLVLKTIRELEKGILEEVPQMMTVKELKSAPKIYTETCQIDWNNSVSDIHNFIRGLSPYPAAFTYLNGKKIKMFSSKMEPADHEINPGSVYTDHKSFLKFGAKDGYIEILELQLEGKKKMAVREFLKGWRG